MPHRHRGYGTRQTRNFYPSIGECINMSKIKTKSKPKAKFSTNGHKGSTVVKTSPALKAKVYHDQDADLKYLKGKRVVVIGYGSQGHGQALNLRDSNIDVHIAVREGGRGWSLALKHGWIKGKNLSS